MTVMMSMRVASVSGVALASLRVEGCRDKLPAAPSELTEGIVIYEDPNFKGWAADAGEENVANDQLVTGPCKRGTFNDCASSVRVYRR